MVIDYIKLYWSQLAYISAVEEVCWYLEEGWVGALSPQQLWARFVLAVALVHLELLLLLVPRKNDPVRSARCERHLPSQQQSPLLFSRCGFLTRCRKQEPTFSGVSRQHCRSWRKTLNREGRISSATAYEPCACVRACVLPAVKLVNLRHVSKQNILLAAQGSREEVGCGRVFHLRPVALRGDKRKKSWWRTGRTRR